MCVGVRGCVCMRACVCVYSLPLSVLVPQTCNLQSGVTYRCNLQTYIQGGESVNVRQLLFHVMSVCTCTFLLDYHVHLISTGTCICSGISYLIVRMVEVIMRYSYSYVGWVGPQQTRK